MSSRRRRASDLSAEQWLLLEPLLDTAHTRGPRFGAELRRVVDGIFSIAHTGLSVGVPAG